MIEEDFQHQLKALYQPPKNEFTYVNVPKMKYMCPYDSSAPFHFTSQVK